MKWQGEELIRIQSFDELRAGMTVVTKDCVHCPNLHVYVLTAFFDDGIACNGCGITHGWDSIESIDHDPSLVNCFACDIGDGVAYRLRDLDDSKEQATTRRREVTA